MSDTSIRLCHFFRTFDEFPTTCRNETTERPRFRLNSRLITINNASNLLPMPLQFRNCSWRDSRQAQPPSDMAQLDTTDTLQTHKKSDTDHGLCHSFRTREEFPIPGEEPALQVLQGYA